MDDARSGSRAHPGHLRITSQQAVDERALHVAGAWMDHQTGRLVHDDDVVVVVQHRHDHRGIALGYVHRLTLQPVDH